jgi:signal transduction histidine kinase
MKSFRTQTIAWFCACLATLLLVIFVGLIICVYDDMKRDERSRLNDLAVMIKQQLPAKVDDVDTDIARRLKMMNARLVFVQGEYGVQLGYALFGGDGLLKAKFHTSSRDPFGGIERGATPRKHFYVKWSNYGEFSSYRWMNEKGYSILVASSYRPKLLSKILFGYIILLPVGLLVSVAMGVFLGRRFARPLEAIAVAVSKVESGDLGVRVPSVATCKEVEHVTTALNAALQEIDKSFERIKQFSSDVAHELRTPLTSLRGTLEVALRRPRSQEDYQATIAAAVEDITEINTIIETLLLLARPGDDRRRAMFMRVSVNEIVEAVRDNLLEYAEEKNVQLEVATNFEPVVNGDKTFLKRLVFNLMHNAIKFSGRGGVAKVSYAVEGSNLLLIITDNGIGISEADIVRVFDRFFRSECSGQPGHGLGLSIAKWIVDLHGGSISVSSKQWQGSVFTVRLPLAA